MGKAYQLRRPERACKSSNNQQGQLLMADRFMSLIRWQRSDSEL